MRFPTLFIGVVLALLLLSCNEEYSSIGLNLRDPDDLLGTSFTNSPQLIAYSVLEDSLSTKNLANNVLGFVKDPTFGTTKASIYTQYMLSGNSVDFGFNPVLDSIVLSLRVTGFFGDTLTPLPIRVYELTEALSADSAYNSHSSVQVDHENLTYDPNYTVTPTPRTKVTIDTNNYDPHLRIRLTDEFGHHFLNNSSQMSSPILFAQFFKGLYITVEDPNQTGSLLNVLLTSTLSNISIYYTVHGVSKRYVLVTSNSAIRFNQFEHDYALASSHFINQVINRDTNDPNLGRDILYAQATGGVKTKIKFPNVKEMFKDKNVVINRAELVITNISEDPEYFFQPAALSLQAVSKKDGIVFIPDDPIYTSGDYFGGNYIADKKQYRIRITRYIQQLILQDQFENYIYLLVSGSGVRGNRLLFAGTDPFDPALRLRLEISYTEF
ncbi:MAG TPA: DUF4270 domain-containing protein [Bacteroidales bacterium]|nr:DUF4270 domain-containing protein [Bacteroidales bacterium]